MLHVSANRRYFEQVDGTPFYWLGDTWWSALSTRLSWDGFQKLTADRTAKGFTVVQIVAGLIPGDEEKAPSDPGYCNEGGCVWEAGFERINPQYFDYADRRIQYLADAGIVPAIVGAWGDHLKVMGIDRLKKHWRYVIARYGSYPVFWVVGGEVFDPPEKVARRSLAPPDMETLGGWTQIAQYVRATDPLHHPTTVHEEAAAEDLPLQDEAITDFQLFQPSHFGWPSIPVEVLQLDTHYARTEVTKPLVVGEIGYEGLGEAHWQDFQRVAFWLAMLNGAAGHTYGANGTWESYTADAPLHRVQLSLLTWDEGMNLPGSYQVGLGSKLLRNYSWWKFEPHPEWVIPRGTTLLEPRKGVNEFHINIVGELDDSQARLDSRDGSTLPRSDWQKAHGTFRQPFAAGVSGEVRFIYIPHFGFLSRSAPTILGLEPHVRYHAYFWEPSLGIKFDVGAVERPSPGTLIRKRSKFTDYSVGEETLSVFRGVNETNLVAASDVERDGKSALVLRFHDVNNYLAAIYSPEEKLLYLIDRKQGADGAPLNQTPIGELLTTGSLRLTMEVRNSWAAASITDGAHSYTSEIVHVKNTEMGGVGLLRKNAAPRGLGSLELRKSPSLVRDEHLDRELYDARGVYRGAMTVPGLPQMAEQGISSWGDLGREKIILLDAYRPDRVPYGRDWILVLEAR
jgi:hypothetical protein